MRMFVALFVGYDVCRIMTFVGHDVCRIMMFVVFEFVFLIGFVVVSLKLLSQFISGQELPRGCVSGDPSPRPSPFEAGHPGGGGGGWKIPACLSWPPCTLRCVCVGILQFSSWEISVLRNSFYVCLNIIIVGNVNHPRLKKISYRLIWNTFSNGFDIPELVKERNSLPHIPCKNPKLCWSLVKSFFW